MGTDTGEFKFAIGHGHDFGLAIGATVAYVDCTEAELERVTKGIVDYAIRNHLPRRWEFAYDRPQPAGGFYWHMIPAPDPDEREFLVRVVQQTTFACVVTADDPASAISLVTAQIRDHGTAELATAKRTIVDCEAHLVGGPGAGAAST